MANLILWKFKNHRGESSLIRPEDFRGMYTGFETGGDVQYWYVNTPDEDYIICDEDAARLADYLEQFVALDFSVFPAKEQLGRWKVS